MNYEFYMQLVLNRAWEAQTLALPNPAVGALVLDESGAILSLCAHEKCGESHAELLALIEAFIKLGGNKEILECKNPFELFNFLAKNHNGIFKKASIFVSLEPCAHIGKTPSCAELLCILEPKKIIISARDLSLNAKGGIQMLKNHGIEVVCGVLENEGLDLLFPFLSLQKNNRFNLFKLAMRANGSFEGGIISNKQTRIFSHKMRSNAARMVVSQKTILSDNPFLDCRLLDSKHAPNLIIVGRKNNLNSNLNIFQAAREVEFCDDIGKLDLSGFSIFEGGAEFFNLMRDKIDCLLLFIAPRVESGRNLYGDFGSKLLYASELNGNGMLWIA